MFDNVFDMDSTQEEVFDKVGNPVSDIADSYFIQKVGYENSIKSKKTS